MIDGKEVRSWGGFNFNSDSTDLRDAFNAELVKFKKTDDWKKILSGYGFTPGRHRRLDGQDHRRALQGLIA